MVWISIALEAIVAAATIIMLVLDWPTNGKPPKHK